MISSDIAAAYADAWISAFNLQFEQQIHEEIARLEYNDATALEARRYMGALFDWAAAIADQHPAARQAAPETSLPPAYKALIEEAVSIQVERWRASQAEFAPNQPLTPAAIDRANPRRLNLDRNRLLNFNPAAYFGRAISWPAPASFNAADFMQRYGLGELAPYTERLRVTTDGRINVLASSRLWFQLFGVGFNWSNLESPLTVTNAVRPQQIANPQLIHFLELIG